MTHSEALRHVLGLQQQRGDRLERSTQIIEIEARNDHAFARSGEEGGDFDEVVVEELALVDANDHSSVLDRSQKRVGIWDGFRRGGKAGM